MHLRSTRPVSSDSLAPNGALKVTLTEIRNDLSEVTQAVEQADEVSLMSEMMSSRDLAVDTRWDQSKCLNSNDPSWSKLLAELSRRLRLQAQSITTHPLFFVTNKSELIRHNGYLGRFRRGCDAMEQRRGRGAAG